MSTMVPTDSWIRDTAYGLGAASRKLSCGTTAWGRGGAINGSWTYTEFPGATVPAAPAAGTATEGAS
ncbi:hypothetical protein [Streptomyces vinaceus]|uniref:hypothetical protein n=1 Tax=Streptomyces vinaceus TaxID=1960 RepID=UPI0037FF4083